MSSNEVRDNKQKSDDVETGTSDEPIVANYLSPVFSWLIPSSVPKNSNSKTTSDHAVWKEIKDSNGKTYYWNVKTNETQWEIPIENEKSGTQDSSNLSVANRKDDKHIQIIEDAKPVDTSNIEATSVDKVNNVDEPDPDIAKYPTGTAYDFDAGLSHNVAAQVETPKTFLERVLVDDEVVVDTFDVKFPGEFIPLWKIVALLISTLGLYSFVLLFRLIRRCFYRRRWCTPHTVHFTFGKMAVTSKGRVLCWKEEVYQFKPPQKSFKGHIGLCYLDYLVYLVLWAIAKCCIVMCCPDLCSPPIEFSTTNSFRSYRIADVKQITQYMTNEALAVFCCLEYQAGVEISFHQFNHGSNHLQIASRSWISKEDHFGEEAQAAASSAKNSSYYNWARAVYGSAKNIVGNIESAAGIAPNADTIFVYTDTADRVHNGDVDSMLRDINGLHERILGLLPILKDAIVAEEIKIKNLKISGAGDVTFLAKMENNNYKLSDKFRNCTIVGNKGEIQIPSSWMPLLPDEVIIATNGQVPRMSCTEWFWSIVSCGIQYCKHYRRRKYTRSALVLTNKRLMSIDIYERSGTIPLTLSNFSIQVRSYILDTVNSGFVYSKHKNHLECGIETTGGALFVCFSGTGRSALPFALALQMSVKRKSCAIRNDMSKVRGDFKEEDFPSVKFHLVPYLTGEHTINVIKGNKSWEPFGQGFWALSCEYLRRYFSCSQLNTLLCYGMNGTDGCCWNDRVVNCCSFETCNDECCCVGQRYTPFFFPCIPYLATCALRPFQQEVNLIITNMSIIRVATHGNYGLCGCFRFLGLFKEGPFVTNDSIMISWSTLDSFSGFNLDITSEGKENVLRRCCRSNCIGQLFCPIGHASAELAIDFKGKYSFKTSKEEPNKIWIKDKALNDSVKILTRLQFAIQEQAVDDAKKNYKPHYLPGVPIDEPSISSVINRV